MSQKVEVTKTQLLEQLFESEDSNLWEILEDLNQLSNEERLVLQQIFSVEQIQFIKKLIGQIIDAMQFHNEPDSDSHQNIVDKINTVEAKLRNHRHETGKTFSAKAEF